MLRTIIMEVPAILARKADKTLPIGTKVTVTKEYWRNGEGWCRTVEFGDIPDVFISSK